MSSIFGFVFFLTFLFKLAQSRLVPPRPNEVILLDSRESGWDSWTKNTASDIGWRQQSRPGVGYTVYGLCETSRASDQEEFWLFGPLIPLERTLSVHVQVNFMMRSCADREIADGRGGSCRENFDVFLEQEARMSDMDAAEVPLIESFKKLATISSDRKWSSTYPSDDAAVTSWLIRFRPQADHSTGLLSTSSATNNGWMRLAIRDQGACLMLDRIRVYYLTCPAWQFKFMSLPETPAGHDAEVREVQGHCVTGAEPVMVGQSDLNQLEASNQTRGLKSSFCKANGQWHILQDNVCECLPGYESSVEKNICSIRNLLSTWSIRIGCPMGTYKPLHGTGFCRPCPPNSKSETSLASSRCVCSHPLYVWQSLANDGGGICSPKLPRINGFEIVERNEERIVLTWKPPLTQPDIPILVAVSCLNCQKEEAVYVPGDVISGNRVTILGLETDKAYTFSFRSCLNKESVPQSCDLRATHLTLKQGKFPAKPKDHPNRILLRKNATETESEEMIPVIRVFHVLLGLAVFICMTLFFIFGTFLLHRYYKSRPIKRMYGAANNSRQTANVINPTATEYRNALFQSCPAGYHQLPEIDPNRIEIVKPLGKGRHGEFFLGNMKSLSFVDKNSLSSRKIFLRPALPKTVIEAAEISSGTRHPNIVFCHGILRAVQPNLLIYNYMAHGRLDRFLVAEIGRTEGADSARKETTIPHSLLLSNRTLFRMLHQIASAFSFLVSASLDNIILDSSAVMVSSDYSCKIQLKTRPSEFAREHCSNTMNELTLKQSLADFMGLPPRSSRVFVVLDGQNIPIPSILKSSASLHSPTTLFQSLVQNLKSSLSHDNLSSEISSTAVRNLGCIQIELLLAAVFYQKCLLRNRASTRLSVANTLEKSSCLSKALALRKESTLLEDVIALITGWFGSELLGCIISSCLDSDASRRLNVVEVENHLVNLSEKDTQNVHKDRVAAVIHNESIHTLPKAPSLAEISIQTKTGKWNNFQLTPPGTKLNPIYSPDTTI